MTRPFRFGIQLRQLAPGLPWAETARKVEDVGFSTLLVPDHFDDQLAVGPSLAAAGAVTSTLRLGALVYGNDYRHPVVLAKEMATLDVLTGGRMELGLGAGWMRTDYEQSGMPYDRPGIRIERMVESLAVIRGLFGEGPFDFAGEHYAITALDGLPKPVQSSPPVLIGGGGRRMLSVAAREADIVAVTANLGAGEVGPEAIADVTPERFDEKLSWVRDAAGDRFDDIELSNLVMTTEITDDQAAVAEGVAGMFAMDADTVLSTPLLLIGSVGQIVEQLHERRERWGFSYITAEGHEAIDALAPVIAQLAGT